jgi:catechol 2,3-dioxygenase-like lactoylglutathione lyase family enzyme
MATSFQVTLDCADPESLSAFWATALGYQEQDPPPGYASWPEFLTAQGILEDEWNSSSAIVDPEGVGPRLYFQRVPEKKVAKNRVHLDVNVGGGRGTPPDERRRRVEEAAGRLIGAGATRLRSYEEYGQFWVVMQDPEGNEFCLQ